MRATLDALISRHSARGRALGWTIMFAAALSLFIAPFAWWMLLPLAVVIVGRWFQRCPRCKDSVYAGPGSLLRLWPAHTCRLCGYDYTQADQ